MFTKEQYREMLYRLTPRGRAWSRERASTLYQKYSAIGQELERIDLRGVQLIEESDPRTTVEMLEDWERALGIPDACTPPALTLERRRSDIVARLTQQGSLSKQFLIDFALNLGFTITIDEFRPFRAGFSEAGDPLTNGDWVYTFLVHAPIETINYFSAGISQAGDPLANWGNDFLECAINKRKPAETIALFAYGA